MCVALTFGFFWGGTARGSLIAVIESMSSGAMFWLTLIATACWPVCFWWMWRISKNQNELLRQLHDQTRRIESLARAEHDMIKETHPQIGQIKEVVEQIAASERKD